jgi:hypothetical protein
MNITRLVACTMLLAWGTVCFAGGNIEILVRDSDGKGKADVHLFRMDAKTNEYAPVTSKATRLGRAYFKVVPGQYKVRIRYTETTPTQDQEIIVTVEDGQSAKFMPMFEKGWSEISTWDNDNGAEGTILYERWDDEKQDYVRLFAKDIRQRRLREMTPLAPGKYRITFINKELLPNYEFGTAEIEIKGGEINVQQFQSKFAPERD